MPAATLYATWGSHLRAKRLDAGLTQAALGLAAGITSAHISNIERGLTSVSDDVRMRLAAALGTTASELFAYPDAVGAA